MAISNDLAAALPGDTAYERGFRDAVESVLTHLRATEAVTPPALEALQATVLDAYSNHCQDALSAFLIIQEGGSSDELYVHVSPTEPEAEAFRQSCGEEGAYRTSSTHEVPKAVAEVGEPAYAFIEEIVRASRSLEVAGGNHE